jgi:hypothetical protein
MVALYQGPKTSPRQSIHIEISPLRCAPVEMTKGRGVLPGRLVDKWKPFIPPKEMKNGFFSANNFPGSTALPFVISTGA